VCIGPQISWRTCYLIEYAGPIFIHLSALVLRPYIYKGVSKSDSMSTIQTLSLGMYVLHYLKREFETAFVHKFSSSTMPFRNVFKNSFHYWILGGVNVAYWVYAPNAIAAKSLSDPSTSAPTVYLGFALWVFGEVSNLYTHIVLSNLRSSGGTERGIPKGFGFNWVTCPVRVITRPGIHSANKLQNYLFEIISMIGLSLVTGSLSQAIFTVAGWYQMQEWAQGKEKRYRQEFGDKYKPKRYPLTPGLPAWGTRKPKTT
jgi:very-long-chain enoyl-CoA reductase